MFVSHEHVYYNNPNERVGYLHPTPYPVNHVYYPGYNVSRFGQFFPPQGGGPMGPPSGAPGQGQQAAPPTSPPPSYVPTQTQQAEAFAVDPGSIRGCLFRFTYVWLRNRQQFWFYPTFVGRTSTSGYRWNGWRWVYFGISLREIQSFTCF